MDLSRDIESYGFSLSYNIYSSCSFAELNEYFFLVRYTGKLLTYDLMYLKLLNSQLMCFFRAVIAIWAGIDVTFSKYC